MTKHIDLANIKESLEVVSKRMQNALRITTEEKAMLKNIKRTKQMRLDELIKYAFENNVKNKRYISNNGKDVMFFGNGSLAATYWNIGSEDLFPVEIEEEITEDTEFDTLVELFFMDGEFCTITHLYNSINGVEDDSTIFIFALIDDKLELIWEDQDNERKQKTTVF